MHKHQCKRKRKK